MALAVPSRQALSAGPRQHRPGFPLNARARAPAAEVSSYYSVALKADKPPSGIAIRFRRPSAGKLLCGLQYPLPRPNPIVARRKNRQDSDHHPGKTRDFSKTEADAANDGLPPPERQRLKRPSALPPIIPRRHRHQAPFPTDGPPRRRPTAPPQLRIPARRRSSDAASFPAREGSAVPSADRPAAIESKTRASCPACSLRV